MSICLNGLVLVRFVMRMQKIYLIKTKLSSEYNRTFVQMSNIMNVESSDLIRRKLTQTETSSSSTRCYSFSISSPASTLLFFSTSPISVPSSLFLALRLPAAFSFAREYSGFPWQREREESGHQGERRDGRSICREELAVELGTLVTDVFVLRAGNWSLQL